MRALLVVLLTGCSSVLGIDNLEGPFQSDAQPPEDVLTDGPVAVPPAIRISGEVQRLDGMQAGTPLAGETISLIDTTPGASAEEVVSDPAGGFELVIMTSGLPVGGAVQAAGNTLRTTRSYFTRPLTGDVSTTIQVFEDAFWTQVAESCGSTFAQILPTIIAVVVDAQGNPLEGVPIASTPSTKWCGQSAGGKVAPDQTGAGGVAFALELPPGPIEITSQGASVTFEAPPITSIVVALVRP